VQIPPSVDDPPNMLLFPMSNPYAAQLGIRDARAVLASTPGLLQQAIAALTPEAIAAPIAPGKWSPREIAAHLADCELAFSFRLRQILAAPASEPALLQPFDQDAWAKHYSGYELPSALELFRANRLWNLKLVGTLSQADLDRPGHHPERGDVTFQTILETMAGHDLNHLAQLQRLAP
jgi:hypothetical protein